MCPVDGKRGGGASYLRRSDAESWDGGFCASGRNLLYIRGGPSHFNFVRQFHFPFHPSTTLSDERKRSHFPSFSMVVEILSLRAVYGIEYICRFRKHGV